MPPRKPPARRRSIWDPVDEAPLPAALVVSAKPRPVAPDGFDEDDEDDTGPRTTFADLEGIKREALKFGEGPIGFLLWMDSRFVAAGQPPLSKWWRATLTEFFASGKTWAVIMAGRGGGKSTSLVRVAILYVLFGCLFAERKVPPGQRWIWPFISASTTDAGRRLSEIQALLMALGIETKPKGQLGARHIDLVDVVGNEVAFLSIAATIAGVSGPSALGGTIDEEAKLRGKERHVNPSSEIVASFGQMFRARPGVHAIRCSSAWYASGSHFASIKEGDTDATYVARIGEEFLPAVLEGLQTVATLEEGRGNADAARAIREHAITLTAASPNVPTWIANPTISALASRREVEATPVDPDEANTPRWQIWLRENASLPMSSAATAGPSVGEFEALGAMNRALARVRPTTFREDGLITVPGYGLDFKPIPGGGRGYRGL